MPSGCQIKCETKMQSNLMQEVKAAKLPLAVQLIRISYPRNNGTLKRGKNDFL